jgi:hypothetical protein
MILKRVKSDGDDEVFRALLAILVGESEPPRDMRFLELGH